MRIRFNVIFLAKTGNHRMKRTNSRSHRLFRTGLISLAVFLSVLICAAPRINPQSPSSQAPSALKPELQPLSFFIGQWSCAGEFPASHKPISSHIVFSPELDGSWLVVRWDDDPPNQFHALELWGFDKTAHHFINSIYNSFYGMYIYQSPGWIGDELTWPRDLPPDSPIVSERYVFDRKSTKEFAVSWEVRKTQASSGLPVTALLASNEIPASAGLFSEMRSPTTAMRTLR